MHRNGAYSVPRCVAWLFATGLLVVLLLGPTIQAAVAQSAASKKAASTKTAPIRVLRVSRKILLEEPVHRVLPVGSNMFVAFDQAKGAILLIDATLGTIRGKRTLDFPLRALIASEENPNNLQLVVLSRTGSVGESVSHVLTFIEASQFGFEGSNFNSRQLEARFKEPAIQSVGRQGVVAAWDRAADRATNNLHLMTDTGPERRLLPRFPPQELFSIGKPRLLLALHPRDNRASLLNTSGGQTEDIIVVEGLSDGEPAQMAVFVPGAVHGGTGEVLIVNGATETLTVLSVPDSKLPRIRPPARIALKVLRSARSGFRNPLLAADRELSIILVGAVGSDRIGILRRIGGGLQEPNSIPLEMPLRDMTVVQGSRPSDPATFIFLHSNGREILLDSDVGRRERDSESDPDSVLDSDLDDQVSVGEIARAQRLLATLGHQIGAIDGVGGPRTKAVVRLFQIENALPVTGNIDRETREALEDAVVKSQKPDASHVEEYSKVLGGSLGGLAPRLLTLGASNEDPKHRCFGLNSLPPRELWRRSVDFARVLRRLEDDGLRVEIVSGYRNANFNRCLRGPAKSSHLQFRGFDLRLADPGRDGSVLLRALRHLREEGLFDGGVEAQGSQIVHVHTGIADTRPGERQD